MTPATAVLVSSTVFAIALALYVTIGLSESSPHKFLAYIGKHFEGTANRLSLHASIGTAMLIVCTCLFVILLGIATSIYFDRIAYSIAGVPIYKVEVRRDFDRARSEYRLMKTDLEGVKQRLSSEQLASVSDRDKQILQTCEGTRLRQLALQADLIRVKEVIAGQSNTQKLSDEDQTMLHALESKMDKLGDQITELSNICSQLGKVGPSFTEKTVIDTDRR
jgi:hypothetical protein